MRLRPVGAKWRLRPDVLHGRILPTSDTPPTPSVMPRTSSTIITLRPSTVRNVLLVGVAVVFALDFVMIPLQYALHLDIPTAIAGRLDSDTERSIATLYSLGLLALASAVCAAIARLGAPRRRAWWSLSAIFLFLTVDEFLQVHEGLTVPVREAVGATGYLFFAWIIPYFLACVALLILLMPWLRGLPRDTRRGFLAAAAIYGLGVFVLEALSAHHWLAAGERIDLYYDISTAFEEGCEMLGVVVFVYFALAYAASLSETVTVRLEDN